jgi:hypothetical protein
VSIARAIRRRRARKNGIKWEGKEPAFRFRRDGSYEALRPTKGWIRFSAARLRAQRRLADMREAIDRRMGRA